MLARVSPWITDSANAFLQGFLSSRGNQINVLEFGSGASTLYFSLRCKKLISFEHDPAWHKVVKKTLRVNNIKNTECHILPRPYSEHIEEVVENYTQSRFTIISIDGRDRVSCLRKCLELNLLAAGGVYILDNTERISGQLKQYSDYIPMLADNFNLMHLEQITPIDHTGWKVPHRWITTIACSKEMQLTTKGISV